MQYQSHVSKQAADNIEAWLTQAKYAEYKNDVQTLIAQQDWNQLEDSFFKVIEFGTGGRRGIVGVGSNRINRVTIGESTQALCEYAKQADANAGSKGIAIACDTRLSSPELSQYVARVAVAAGFKVYIFSSFRSTPELSFAVRELGCAAGVVITASHNAPEYNGFKAYWNDGAQLVAPHDIGVLKEADKIKIIQAAPSFSGCVEEGSIIAIGDDMDKSYFNAVINESVGSDRELRIAYSPLHGAGSTNTLPVLRLAGFTDILTVEEQMVPDGNFPTMEDGRANPEKKLANDRVVALMLAEEADIALSNDPDADRIGVMVRHKGQAKYLSGNQAAVLVTEFALNKMHVRGEITPHHYIAKTIVTTDMLNVIADKYEVECVDNLHVGFKWICKEINEREKTGGVIVTGSEESFGLMKGSYTRDKDGAVGLLVAEYAAELKLRGATLYDRLLELYAEHGIYAETLTTATCAGAEGFADMQKIMASLREDPVESIGGYKTTATLDYKTGLRKELSTNKVTRIDADSADVLTYEFGDKRRRITVRPSGTEPIMKFYVQWYNKKFNLESNYVSLSELLESMAQELEGLALKRA